MNDIPEKKLYFFVVIEISAKAMLHLQVFLPLSFPFFFFFSSLTWNKKSAIFLNSANIFCATFRQLPSTSKLFSSSRNEGKRREKTQNLISLTVFCSSLRKSQFHLKLRALQSKALESVRRKKNPSLRDRPTFYGSNQL